MDRVQLLRDLQWKIGNQAVMRMVQETSGTRFPKSSPEGAANRADSGGAGASVPGGPLQSLDPGKPLDSAFRTFFEPRVGYDFSRVLIHRGGRAAESAHAVNALAHSVHPQQRPVRVASGPANSFEDCPLDWQRQANAAVNLGRQWVANTIVGLSNLPSPIPAPVSRLLNRHFHTTNSRDIGTMLRVFSRVNEALNAEIDFECETSCDNNTAAYVYTIWTDVHLCPIWYGQTMRGKANTIVHELAHDAAGRDDEAYIWEANYAHLSVEDALDNADSYSHFAEDAFYGP